MALALVTSALFLTIATLSLCVLSCSVHGSNSLQGRKLRMGTHHRRAYRDRRSSLDRRSRRFSLEFKEGPSFNAVSKDSTSPSSGGGSSEGNAVGSWLPDVETNFNPSSSLKESSLPQVPPCPPNNVQTYGSNVQPLLELRDQLNISEWDKGSVQTACRTWTGICCDAYGQVASISTAGVSASGFVPESLSTLQGLTSLQLVLAELNETLPSFVSSMTSLKDLSFEGTRSNSTFFQHLTWIASLVNLQRLSLSDAGLGGYIPEDFTALTALTSLEVSRNELEVIPCWINSLQSLSSLEMWDTNVYGTIPTELGALPNLHHLDLGSNEFFGSIPTRLLNLTQLQLLDLSDNQLEGSIPPEISNLISLSVLRLTNNSLQGQVPSSLFSLPELIEAQIAFNQLQSPLPDRAAWAQATKLTALNLSRNAFTGALPAGVGSAPALQFLSLGHNNFSGAVPSTWSALTGLKGLWLEYNQVAGSFETFSAAKGLQFLWLSNNQFNGSFPSSFSELTDLLDIRVPHNNISGPFPDVLMMMPSLQHFDVGFNRLSGTLPETLGKWRGNHLHLNNNEFSGPLPLTTSNLTTLQVFDVSFNKLSGSPDWNRLLGGMRNVSTISLNNNQFSGGLPELSGHSSLVMLNVGNNSFSGPIPNSISNLKALTAVYFSLNGGLDSTLPSGLAELTNLRAFYAGGNRITGEIPEFLGALTNLAFFSFANNLLTGAIPHTLCRLTSLTFINIANNSFYGEIPSCLYLKPGLRLLDASGNFLFGTLQNQFVTFDPQVGGVLDLSRNYLYGDPPLFFNNTAEKCDGVDRTLVTMPKTIFFPDIPVVYTGSSSLAQNCFLPNDLGKMCDIDALLAPQRASVECMSFCGTNGTKQCGGYGQCMASNVEDAANIYFNCSCSLGFVEEHEDGQVETCVPYVPAPMSAGAIAGITVACVFFVSAIIVGWMVMDYRHKWLAKKRWRDLHVCTQYSLARVEKATHNWAEENVLGEGAYGTVYRGNANGTDGEAWAVKRAKLLTNGFEMEVRAMAVLNHKNLVRLLGFCANYNPVTGIQEQILVYEFAPNGDLGMHLHNRKGRPPLSLDRRLHIMIGTCEGVAYLHSFDPPIIHRDIKPENILLDINFEPKIADFGLLRRLDSADQATRVAGTPGYVDPEYNRSRMISSKTDVYSLGVVLLELISGKRPLIEDHEDENMPEVHIVQWVRPRFEEWNAEAIQDPTLLCPSDAIMEVALVAVDCVRSPALARPEMKEVAYRLQAIREKYAGMLDVVHCSEDPAHESPESTQGQEANPGDQALAAVARRRSAGRVHNGIDVPRPVPEEEADAEDEELMARIVKMHGQQGGNQDELGSALELRFEQVRDTSQSWIEDKSSLNANTNRTSRGC